MNQNGTSRPVSRPWPPGYTSALVCLDDDFIKGMAANRVPDTGLFALRGGAGDDVWLAVRPTRGPQGSPAPRIMLNIGLRVGGEVSWAAAAVPGDATHLVVLDTRGGRARLWVNPAPGQEPPPLVTRPLPGGFRAASIQVGDPASPPYCWWFLDELRVAPTWDAAVPLAAGV